MRLPSLTITLSLIAVCWCVFGVSIHGWYILLYPAAWMVIAIAFYFGHKMLEARGEKASVPPTANDTHVPKSSLAASKKSAVAN